MTKPERNEPQLPRLIQCANHSMAPYAFVCVHLIYGEAVEWVPDLSAHAEIDYDWFCPACFKQWQDATLTYDKIRPVCMHCIRKNQAKPGMIVREYVE